MARPNIVLCHTHDATPAEPFTLSITGFAEDAGDDSDAGGIQIMVKVIEQLDEWMGRIRSLETSPPGPAGKELFLNIQFSSKDLKGGVQMLLAVPLDCSVAAKRMAAFRVAEFRARIMALLGE